MGARSLMLTAPAALRAGVRSHIHERCDLRVLYLYLYLYFAFSAIYDPTKPLVFDSSVPNAVSFIITSSEVELSLSCNAFVTVPRDLTLLPAMTITSSAGSSNLANELALSFGGSLQLSGTFGYAALTNVSAPSLVVDVTFCAVDIRNSNFASVRVRVVLASFSLSSAVGAVVAGSMTNGGLCASGLQEPAEVEHTCVMTAARRTAR